MRHPAGLDTNDFEFYRPNDVQLQSTAWRVKDRDHYRRKYRPNYFLLRILILALVLSLVWLGMEIAK